MVFRPRLYISVAALALLAACGPKTEPPPPSSTEAETPAPEPGAEPPPESGSGFLTLRPPAKPDQRPPEPAKPALPRLIILHESDALPESWLQEWKSDRALVIKQRPWPGAGEPLPTDVDVFIASAQRLAAAVPERGLHDLSPLLPPPHANPLFLHHAFDPENRATRPFRWSPYMLYRFRPNAEAAFPALAISWKNDEGILWPDDLPKIRALWLKSQGLSANHPQSGSGWSIVEAALLPHLRPAETAWNAFLAGEVPRTWLPAAYRFRLEPEKRNDGTIDWVIPGFGTLIHLDVLALSATTDQPGDAASLMAFLTDKAQQDRLGPETGWLPVHRPLGQETQDTPIALPTGDWLDKSELIFTPSDPLQPAPLPEPAPDSPHDVPPPETETPATDNGDSLLKELK